MPWHEIGSRSEFPNNTTKEMVVSDRIVAVCNSDDELYALDGICPHQGGPLGQGEIDGCILTCPWHGWQFDVRDGQSQLSPHVKHPTLPLKIENGIVSVELD